MAGIVEGRLGVVIQNDRMHNETEITANQPSVAVRATRQTLVQSHLIEADDRQ